MRLRTKIIATVAAVMILSLLIMSLAVLKLSLDYERVRRDEIRQLLRKELVHVYVNMDERAFFDYLRKSTVLGEWYFFRGRDMIASSETGRMTKNRIYTSVKLDSREPGAKLVFIIQGNRIIHTSHFTFFITWLLCTVLMAGILYLTLSRLVIKPIDIVVKAGRQASRGIKPGINPLPGRTDEAGLMVREFYGLLEEIYEYRTHLEKKVSQVSEEVRRTHEKLIVSQRLSATGKLAAGIAHEINNPLGGMLNAVSALKKPGSAEKRKEYFSLIEECVHRIENLVKELLTFVRVDREFSEVDLAESIDFARRMVKHYLEEKKITFETETEGAGIITGNTAQIQQMLLNLFLNSIHGITDPGGVITVKTAEKSESDSIELTVEDNGCGIPSENLDTVFDLFSSSREDGEGTGLGLSIVHSIVKNHDGSIFISSEEGAGTAVTVLFPGTTRKS